MNALNRMWATLRPGGALLDIRPAPECPWVEIQHGERVVKIGQIDDSYRIGTLQIADAAVQTMVDAERFTQERDERFTFVYHLSSVDAWLAYMADHWNSAVLVPDLIARARETLPPGADGELRILRTIRAARLRRV